MDQLARIQFNPKREDPALKPAPIPWPEDPGAPKWLPLDPAPRPGDALPLGDVLVVTYTSAEGEALADVLTHGHKSSDWVEYENGWSDFLPLIGKGAPSLSEGCAGRWAVAQIGDLRVVLVKSNFHPSTDGPQLPMVALWVQMIEQVQPKLVLTTGTAGGVGADTLLGDVIVTNSVRWDATTKFAKQAWAKERYTSDGGLQTLVGYAVQQYLAEAEQKLFAANAAKLPPASRGPAVIDSAGESVTTITTDFFAFDDKADHYGLRAYEPSAHAVEMDDAALGLACHSMTTPPPWLSIRNASDPQMDGPTLREEDQQAAAIYRRYGYWTTVMSAITVYAVIAGFGDAN